MRGSHRRGGLGLAGDGATIAANWFAPFSSRRGITHSLSWQARCKKRTGENAEKGKDGMTLPLCRQKDGGKKIGAEYLSSGLFFSLLIFWRNDRNLVQFGAIWCNLVQSGAIPRRELQSGCGMIAPAFVKIAPEFLAPPA